MTKVEQLLTDYRKNKNVKNPEKIIFKGVTGHDIYNITAPFHIDGKDYIAGRVEKRDSEHSKAYFFYKNTDEWIWDENTPTFDLQDPFVTFIDGELIFGGVEIFESKEDPEVLEWRTVFYKGKSLNELSLFFEGPMGMKDIRLQELADDRILVLTRPQGEKGGRGKIGAVIIPSLSDLTLDIFAEDVLFDELHEDDEWAGGNELHLLNENTVGVLGHVANFDEDGGRHYYPVTFKIDLDTLTTSELKMIAERKDFLPGPAKRPDLEDVIFSGGIKLNGEEAEFYAGVSDAEAQKIEMINPFL